MSLRTRLVLGLLALATLGLLVADVVTYTSLRSFLLDRTDSALENDHVAVEQSLRGADEGVSCRTPLDVAPEVFVQIRFHTRPYVCTKHSSDLSKLSTRGSQPSLEGKPRPLPSRPSPRLAAQIALPPDRPENQDRAVYFNTAATVGGSRYRVRAGVESDVQGGVTLIVARPLDDVEDTLHQLLVIELLVTGGVLAAIAVLGLWTVRLGLRPLEEMGKTADAIAGGDLTRRVEPADERTEVGRLGLALNAMLHEIEVSDQRLRRFVADASHELRTPLAAVRAYAELFGRGADRHPDDLARAMSGISRESERMTLLVDDLLLLARLDEGRPLERKRVRLDQVAGEAVDAARALEPERRLELDSEPVIVLGDHHRLRQIFDNLLANVRSHTPTHSAASVRVREESGRAVIEVADSGPGLAADEAERVFERFYRADASRSRTSGGVGLGLAIVQAVAEAHDGTVSASSEPGRGTTFRISLPLAE
jgi:two-component system, OmpR family, sensor kinase